MSEDVQTHRVGMCRVDITPPVGIKLSGFAARTESSAGVYHPPAAVAVAIDDGVTPLLLVGADLLGFYDQAERVRASVVEASGLPAAQVILNGSHTHCGPCLRQCDARRFGPGDLLPRPPRRVRGEDGGGYPAGHQEDV